LTRRRALTGHKGPVLKVVYGVEGRSVISGGQDGTVRFWPDEPPDEPEALRAWIEKALPDVIELRPVSR
jgi:hypothetical protein